MRSVRTKPGHSDTTVTPNGASSRAVSAVMRSSAHLPTPYATCHAYSSAPDELTLAMSPDPAAVIARAANTLAT